MRREDEAASSGFDFRVALVNLAPRGSCLTTPIPVCTWEEVTESSQEGQPTWRN